MSDLLIILRTLAWGLGLWLAVSVVATVAISFWFRRQARANELLSVAARRREFVEAATAPDSVPS